MAFKIFRKITAGVSTQHWTLDDPDWDKHSIETDKLEVMPHTLTKVQILALGATEISQADWTTYTGDVFNIPGSRPPHKP